MKSRTSAPTTILDGTARPDRFTFLRAVRRVGFAPAVVLLLIMLGFASPFSGQSAAVATVGLTAGWATFGEVVPPGAATTGLQVGTLPTQTDIKNRWPDGSIRFAIVTAQVPEAGEYAVTAAEPAAGALTPAWPTAATTLIVDGVAYTAALPDAPAADLWLTGPLVSEGRSVVAPITAGGTPHAFLRVNFDTRVYADGTARVDVSVENLLDQAGATTVTYDATIVVNREVRFAQRAVEHFYLTRWRKVFEIGSTPFAAVTPDLTPFHAAGALPPYLSLVTDVVSTPAGAAYDILREGALSPNMAEPRGRPELAPFPDWTARYLVHRDARQRAFVLANGDLSGSWPVHVREADDSAARGVGTERLLSLDQRPTLWYDARAEAAGIDHVRGTPLPPAESGPARRVAGQTALMPDNAHQPSLAFVPYLMTGDRYYAEEMAFWANYGMLRTAATDGVRGAEGILANNEVRGIAWALRNLADAAAYYPDASPVSAYLAAKVHHNLQWLDAYAAAQDAGTNPQTILWTGRRPEGPQVIALWEQNDLAYALDRASRLGFAGGTAHRDAIARLQLRLFTSEPDYPRSEAAPALVTVGAAGNGALTLFPTLAEIGNATPRRTRPFAAGYGAEARLSLMIAVERGWAGARAAYDYLWPFLAEQSTWGPVSDLGERAGWALDFSSPVGSSPTAASRPDPAGSPGDSSVGFATPAQMADARVTADAATAVAAAAPAVSQLSYLGKFSLPAGFEYGGRGLAFNPARNSLFASGLTRSPLTAEVSIPAIGGTAGILQALTDPTEGRAGQVNPGDSNDKMAGGYLVAGDRLIVSVYSYYDGSGTATLSHFVRPLSLSTRGQVVGPVRVGALGAGFYAGYMADVPVEWRAALGGPALTGQALISIINRTSYGPAAFAFNPSAISPSGAVPLVYYDAAHPTLGAWGHPAQGVSAPNPYPYVGIADEIAGVVFPQGTSSVLFFGRHATTTCYGEGAPCGDPTDAYKGTHGYPYQPVMLVYDANQLAAVKAGTLKPWEVQPTAKWVMPFTDSSGAYHISGAAYDPAAGRIYVGQYFTNGARSVIHVFGVASAPGDTTAPAIGAVASASITATSATIGFTTNEPAFHQVEYGLTTAYGTQTALDTTLRTTHSQALTGLTPGRLYHYRARATDAAGNTGMSADFTFTTVTSGDATAPVISGVGSSNLTSSGAVINFTTNEPAFHQVEYGRTTAYGTLTTLDTTLRTSHQQALTGLTAGTVYHYRARAADAAGNERMSGDFTFTTAGTPPPPAAISIWSASAAPTTFATADTASVELGLKFRSDVAGTVTGVRFYKGAITTGTHTGTLWTASGTKLASATFTNETASGWQTVSFSSPIAIAANTVYIVSYHSNVGRYAYTAYAFTNAGVDNGPLHALKAGVSGDNGVYTKLSSIAFPTSSYNSSNYWVDIVFAPAP